MRLPDRIRDRIAAELAGELEHQQLNEPRISDLLYRLAALARSEDPVHSQRTP